MLDARCHDASLFCCCRLCHVVRLLMALLRDVAARCRGYSAIDARAMLFDAATSVYILRYDIVLARSAQAREHAAALRRARQRGSIYA